MTKIKKITKHGQDTMPFLCDSCNNHVQIDTYDVLTAAEGTGLHCPICGAESEYLEVEPISKEHENEKN